MSEDIDYDELDKAVSGAIGADGASGPAPDPSPAPDQSEEDTSIPVSIIKSKPKPPASRGRYMDMVSRHAAPKRPAPAPKPAPTKIEHTTEFGVIEDVVRPSEVDFIATPTPFDASIPVKKSPKVATPQPTPPPAPVQAPPPTPEPLPTIPENFSLIGQSPFLENPIVEKRPLSSSLPSSNPTTVKSTKNIYSAQSAANARAIADEFDIHEIVEPKRKSGIARFFLVLLVLAAGAAVGAAAWYFLLGGAS